MLVDTHAHLNFPDYKKDLDRVIDGSVKNGVSKIICVSSNIADSQKAIEIASKYKGIVFAAVGIHPQKTDPENTDSPEKQIRVLEKLAKDKKVIAIGECGLDFSPAPPGEKDRLRDEQFFLFKEQIEIAKREKLPILVHSRKAFQETIKFLEESKLLKGVFHCYSAGKKGIEKVNKLGFYFESSEKQSSRQKRGFYFGVDGNLTYDEGLQNVFKLILLEKILLETDCPFLSPEPKRGKRNEPVNVKIIAQCLAKLKGVSFEKVAKITTENAKGLFTL